MTLDRRVIGLIGRKEGMAERGAQVKVVLRKMASHHLAITLPRGRQKSEDASAVVSLQRPIRFRKPWLGELDPLIYVTVDGSYWRMIPVQQEQGWPGDSSWHEATRAAGFIDIYSTVTMSVAALKVDNPLLKMEKSPVGSSGEGLQAQIP